MTTAQDIIDILELERHPEGGWYIQTFRDEDHHDGRAHSTAIYYLLEGGDRSHWHTVDAVEIWHYHAGAPLELGLSDDGLSIRTLLLGNDLKAVRASDQASLAGNSKGFDLRRHSPRHRKHAEGCS